MVGEEAHPVVAEICLVDINDEVLAPSPKRCSHTYLARFTNHLQTYVLFRMIKSLSEAHERTNLGMERGCLTPFNAIVVTPCNPYQPMPPMPVSAYLTLSSLSPPYPSPEHSCPS
jgi:hypothetical protein